MSQVHAITRLFTATLVVQVVGLLLNTLHLLVFSSDGVGFLPLNIAGDLFNILAQVGSYSVLSDCTVSVS